MAGTGLLMMATKVRMAELWNSLKVTSVTLKPNYNRSSASCQAKIYRALYQTELHPAVAT